MPRVVESFDRPGSNVQGSAQMLLEFGFRVPCHLDGGELPHARKQHSFMRTGVFHQQRAAARVQEYGGGNFHPYSRPLTPRSRDLVNDALLVRATQPRVTASL